MTSKKFNAQRQPEFHRTHHASLDDSTVPPAIALGLRFRLASDSPVTDLPGGRQLSCPLPRCSRAYLPARPRQVKRYRDLHHHQRPPPCRPVSHLAARRRSHRLLRAMLLWRARARARCGGRREVSRPMTLVGRRDHTSFMYVEGMPGKILCGQELIWDSQ